MPRKRSQNGCPSELPADKGAQQLARAYTVEAVEALAHVMKHGQSESARVAAANALLDRGHGKAPQFHTGDVQRLRRAIDMTDDELAAIASGERDYTVEAISPTRCRP